MKYSAKVLSAIATYNAARAACLAMENSLAATAEARNALPSALVAAADAADKVYVDAFAKVFSASYSEHGNGERATAEASADAATVAASAAHDAARAAIDEADAANNELSRAVWQLGSNRADASAALDAALAEYYASLGQPMPVPPSVRLDALNPQRHAMAVALTDAANAAAEAEAEERRLAAARVVERGEYSRRLAAGELPN